MRTTYLLGKMKSAKFPGRGRWASGEAGPERQRGCSPRWGPRSGLSGSQCVRIERSGIVNTWIGRCRARSRSDNSKGVHPHRIPVDLLELRSVACDATVANSSYACWWLHVSSTSGVCQLFCLRIFPWLGSLFSSTCRDSHRRKGWELAGKGVGDCQWRMKVAG